MTISEAIKKSGTSAFLNKGAINQAQDNIHEGETILFAAVGNMSIKPVVGNLQADVSSIKDKDAGVFVITTSKVFFSSKTLGIGGVQVIDIQSIQSYDDNQSVLGCVFRVIGLTEMFVFDCNKKMLVALREAMQTMLSLKQRPTPSIPKISVADELKKFKELLDMGAITQDEYDIKKSQLLGM